MSFTKNIYSNKVFLFTYSALMTSVVFLTTIVISIYIPATQGFFNIGEFGVYIAALTGGPIVGLIAGGLGSALADIFLGYTHYAPITLLVKGVEGALVGYIAYRFREINISRGIGISITALTGLSLAMIGSIFYVGEAELSIFGMISTISISSLIWIAIALGLVILGLYLIRRNPSRTGDIIAMLIGGSEMITGYFIAQYILFGAAAYVELFYNFMQVIIGMTLALITYTYLEKIQL